MPLRKEKEGRYNFIDAYGLVGRLEDFYNVSLLEELFFTPDKNQTPI
jgi:hypothetical protein